MAEAAELQRWQRGLQLPERVAGGAPVAAAAPVAPAAQAPASAPAAPQQAAGGAR